MKVYISFDFEGMGGVAFWKETNHNAKYEELVTKQVLAFCNGITERNPECKIVLADSHNYGDNLLWELLPDNVELIKGYPRKFYMMEGIDNTFTHFALLGYHSRVGGGGMMDHTYSGSSIYEIKINDTIVDEALINSYLASERGVKLNFVFGDDVTCAYLKEYCPNTAYLVSKEAISRFSGKMKPYHQLLQELKEEGRKLVDNEGSLIKPELPMRAEITLMDSSRAYICSVIPGVELSEPRKITFSCQSAEEFYRYLCTVTGMCYSAKAVE